MKNKLIIIGAGGHGKVIIDIAKKMNKWQSVAILDDDETITTFMSYEVIGNTADAFIYKDEADFFVAIGNNTTREKVQKKLLDEGLNVVTLIHPDAVIGTNVEIEKGTAIMAGVVINSSSRVGKGCIINTSSSIDHDNIIEDYVHISPGVKIAGNVVVGHNTWLGIGSIVSNNINICSGCVIGAGSVIINDINKSGIYVGVPVRRVD